MFRLISKKEGVFGLLLFFCFTLHPLALAELYTIFNLPTKRLSKWLTLDRNNAVKDLFIYYEHLPARHRKYRKILPLHFTRSPDNKTEFAFVVIDANKPTDVTFVVGGIKRGSITVNGLKRATIFASSPLIPTVLKARFESGRYLFVVQITERFDPTIQPVVLLNKKLRYSQTKSFTRKSLAHFTSHPTALPRYITLFAEWHERACFPSKDRKKKYKTTLLSLLEHYVRTQDKMVAQTLREAGFTDTMLEWWRQRLLQGKCHGGED